MITLNKEERYIATYVTSSDHFKSWIIIYDTIQINRRGIKTAPTDVTGKAKLFNINRSFLR